MNACVHTHTLNNFFTIGIITIRGLQGISVGKKLAVQAQNLRSVFSKKWSWFNSSGLSRKCWMHHVCYTRRLLLCNKSLMYLMIWNSICCKITRSQEGSWQLSPSLGADIKALFETADILRFDSLGMDHSKAPSDSNWQDLVLASATAICPVVFQGRNYCSSNWASASSMVSLGLISK